MNMRKIWRGVLGALLTCVCMSASAQFAGIGGGLYGFNTTGSGSTVILNSGAPTFSGAGPILFSNATDNNILNWLGPTGNNNSYIGITFTGNYVGDAAAGDMFMASDGKAIRFSAGVSRASTQLKVDSTGATVTGIVAASGLVTSRARNIVEILCNSAVAVSAGADTTEDTLYTCAIPGGAMGANGSLRVTAFWTMTNSGNAKIGRLRFSGASGTVLSQWSNTTANVFRETTTVANRNATNSQVSNRISNSDIAVWGALGGGASYATSAIDTTASTTVVITCQKASSGETCTLERVLVELLYGV